MTKNIIDSSCAKEVNEWTYPIIEIKDELSQFEDKSKNEEVKPEKTAEQIKLEEELIKLEQIKQAYKEQYELLKNVLLKLNDPLTVVDDQLIDLFYTINKAVIKNIVGKEIDSDPNILLKMINELKELLHEKNGIINIFLSENDFNKLEKIENDLIIKSDPVLNKGDVVIKSNHAEIRVLLNERIDKILGLK